MNLDEKQPGCSDALLVSKFKEDLRVCREALLEAKQRVIILEQRLRMFLTCLVVLLGVAILYGTIQIWQTSSWLHDFGNYVKQERDSKWEKWMEDVRRSQNVINDHINKTKTQ